MEADDPSRVPPVGQVLVSATVLLVEDDALVRECLRGVVDELGSRVRDAASAAEALELIAAEEGNQTRW